MQMAQCSLCPHSQTASCTLLIFQKTYLPGLRNFCSTPPTSNLHWCGALTPGQVSLPASWSRDLSVHCHIEESWGINRLGLNCLNIFSRFSRLCWETKGFLCQEKSETLQTGMDGQAGLILWADSLSDPETNYLSVHLRIKKQHANNFVCFLWLKS